MSARKNVVPSCPEPDPWPGSGIARPSAWLERFWAGDRDVLSTTYTDHFETVWSSVGRVVSGADQETIVHEVFCRLIATRAHRESFKGGSLAAWLTTVARNVALDHHRRGKFEVPSGTAHELERTNELSWVHDGEARSLEARILIDRFRRTVLPAKWQGVFETRFLAQLDQSEAARRLRIHRSTLVYQEYKVRRLLKRFVLHANRGPNG